MKNQSSPTLFSVQVAEVASAMLDSKLVSLFNKYPDVIDTIHFSDQYTGPKPADVSQLQYLLLILEVGSDNGFFSPKYQLTTILALSVKLEVGICVLEKKQACYLAEI